MGSINSVNGNSNASSAMASMNDKMASMNEKMSEIKKEVEEKAAGAAKKTDNVEISEKAEKLSKSEKTETTPAAQSEAKVEAATQHNNAVEKATTSNEPKDIKDVIKEKKAEVKQVKKDLKEIGVDKKEIKQIEKDAKKEASASVEDDLKQISNDYKAHAIDKSELKDAIYDIASKKLDVVITSMKDAYTQKMAFIHNNDGSETQSPRESIFTMKSYEPTLVEKAADDKKEKSEESKAAAKKDDKTAMEAKPAINAEPKIKEKATPPGLEKKEELPPGQEVKAEKTENVEENTTSKLEKALKEILKEILKSEKETPPGLEKKEELPGNSGNAIEAMFNEIEKMVSELDQEAEGTEEKSSVGEFVNGLKQMFGSGNGVEGNAFLKGLNKVSDEDSDSGAQIKAETLSGLLKGGSTNSAYGVNRVGDNGEGSGNFTAVNFMSDMSNNVEDGLDSYKDAKEAREAAAENQAQQAGAEAHLSEVA